VSRPATDLKIVDNVFVKLHHFLHVGDTHEGHAHAFDHITLLANGSVKMVHDNGEAEYKAPHLIVTPKGIKHQFTALEPNTVFCCIHAIREKDELDGVARPDITIEEAWELLGKNSLTKDQNA
jgi:dTDP-4-dehydrorhamnose 3,5-epimerase-like enzyme